jgi:cyclopropane fatty-acyl-phospholipid synthase-like methyltransferase
VQDIHINKLFPNINILGINIVPEQLEYSKKTAKKEKVDHRIQYILKDAAKLLFKENVFDRIISIEAAIHFNTRETFLQQAFKCLKKDGVICIADTTQNIEELEGYCDLKSTLSMIGIPKKNLINEQEYFKLLKDIGFKEIKFINITEYVIPYASIQLLARDDWRSVDKLQLPKNIETLNQYISIFKERFLYHNYFIIKATK